MAGRKILIAFIKIAGSVVAGYGLNELISKDEGNDRVIDIYKSVGKKFVQSKAEGEFLDEPNKEDSVQIVTLIAFIAFGGIFLLIYIIMKGCNYVKKTTENNVRIQYHIDAIERQ